MIAKIRGGLTSQYLKFPLRGHSTRHKLATLSTMWFEHSGDSNEFYTQFFEPHGHMDPVKTKCMSVDISFII